ncbi:hypothetical protein AAP_04458 [Ascosphaera apis ARSEF 7405]|uniref:Uncharacterized protein n=1 Tax=Ascosphaera apis ARSEF 7405 TaxID=392613 RepID=A0A167WUZ0_9EURO|nr:hypothetical protein AAP_04458 [Ascosphaera apis ARSEF 7405]
MPPPSDQRQFIEPPPEVVPEAVKGFGIGALRYASLSVLLHVVLSMPHPMVFRPDAADKSTAITPEPPKQSSKAAREAAAKLRWKQTPLIYRPLQSFSSFCAPASKVYRGLTPQFKVFIQIGIMSLGGYLWAESRVNELREKRRYQMRLAERRAKEAGGY